MSVYRFEDLRVWRAAKEQCDRVGTLRFRPGFSSDRELSDQMNAAAISVMLNVAEGFLRRRDKETAQFLRYAIGSNAELKSAYYAAEGRRHLTAIETRELIVLNESIAKMLHRWRGTLDIDENRPSNRATSKEGRTKGQHRTEDQGRTKD